MAEHMPCLSLHILSKAIPVCREHHCSRIVINCHDSYYHRDHNRRSALIYQLASCNGCCKRYYDEVDCLRNELLLQVSFFFSSRRQHTIWTGDWSSDVCSSDLFRLSIFKEFFCILLQYLFNALADGCIDRKSVV